MVRFAFSSVIGPSKYLRSNHAIADSPADGQVTRWSPIGEEAHGVAFLLGGGR